MPNEGYIRIYRKMTENVVMSDPWLCYLWMWCLLKTNWKDGWFRGVEIPTGSFAFDLRGFAEQLGVSKSKLDRGLRALESNNMIHRTTYRKVGHGFSIVSICQWRTYQNLEHVEWDANGTQTGRKRDANESANGTYRRREEGNKEIKEEQKPSCRKKRLAFSDEEMEVARWMFRQMQDAGVWKWQREAPYGEWANEIRLIRERDGRTLSEIKDVFSWANNDDFWRVNILSPQSLRKQWDKLVLRMDRQAKPTIVLLDEDDE